MEHWTTEDLPVTDQFGYWRDAICDAFTPLFPRRPAADPTASSTPGAMSGWVRAAPVGSIRLAEIASEPQLHIHGRSEVARTTEDVTFVNLVLEGTCVGSQAGRTCVVNAGDFALFDATRPFGLDYRSRWRVLSMKVPNGMLTPLITDSNGRTAVSFSPANASAHVAGAAMTAVWQRADRMGRADVLATNSALLTLIASAAGSSREDGAVDGRSIRAETRAAINTYVAEQIRFGSVPAEHTARRFSISVRKLHQLYEETDLSYARTVMKSRVEACAADLDSSTRPTSMSTLAARWGFADLSHLNRVFRTHKGCLPSEYLGRRAASPSS
ncbi:helix-turn-helix domain-containing protein [Rhodococcus sp. NPDC006774]|uniref:AraC-like ligand-binding domain-containing protein n=1 Tax=Rhodococcus sp. NPDC006774 TaxID=3157186 RepID=UPI003411E32E